MQYIDAVHEMLLVLAVQGFSFTPGFLTHSTQYG